MALMWTMMTASSGTRVQVRNLASGFGLSIMVHYRRAQGHLSARLGRCEGVVDDRRGTAGRVYEAERRRLAISLGALRGFDNETCSLGIEQSRLPEQRLIYDLQAAEHGLKRTLDDKLRLGSGRRLFAEQSSPADPGCLVSEGERTARRADRLGGDANMPGCSAAGEIGVPIAVCQLVEPIQWCRGERVRHIHDLGKRASRHHEPRRPARLANLVATSAWHACPCV